MWVAKVNIVGDEKHINKLWNYNSLTVRAHIIVVTHLSMATVLLMVSCLTGNGGRSSNDAELLFVGNGGGASPFLSVLAVAVAVVVAVVGFVGVL